jgi:hypothetical protein
VRLLWPHVATSNFSCGHHLFSCLIINFVEILLEAPAQLSTYLLNIVGLFYSFSVGLCYKLQSFIVSFL